MATDSSGSEKTLDAGTIKLNFDEATDCAKEVRNIATKLNKIAIHDYSDSILDIYKAWEGSAARKFNNKARKKQSEMLKLVKELNSIAEDIDTSAASYKKAETNALNKINSGKK